MELFSNKFGGIMVLMAVLLIPLSCAEEKPAGTSNIFAPKVVQAKGYLVPPEEIQPPELIGVQDSIVIPSGKPKVFLLESESILARTPPVVKLEVSSITTPGQGIYKQPMVVPVSAIPVISRLPNMVAVMPPQVNYSGATSYSTYNITNGLSTIGLLPYQDSKGNFWLGDFMNGVDKYDGRSITRYTIAQGLISNTVTKIFEDRKGNMWFCTYFGLSKFDGKYFTNFSTDLGLPDRAMLDMIEDRKGNLWFCSRKGITKYDGSSFTNFTAEQGLDHWIEKLMEDTSGNIWMLTLEGQLIKYDGATFTKYVVDDSGQPNHLKWSDFSTTLLTGTFDGESYIKYSSIRDSESKLPNIVYSKDGTHIWLAYPSSADPQAMALYYFDGAHINPEGMVPNAVAITEDKNGNLWLNTNYGLSKIHRALFSHLQIEQGLSDNIIRSVFLSKDGTLWVGTFEGFHQITRNRVSQFKDDNGKIDWITAISEDQKGNLWLAKWNYGAIKFNGVSFTHYPQTKGGGMWCIMEDSKGHIWFGTDDGVIEYDGTSSYYYSTAQGLSGKQIIKIIEDKNRNLWFASLDNGLTKYDGTVFTQFGLGSGLNDLNIRSLLEDSYGQIWVGTGNGGVFKYDGETFAQYTTEQGLSSNIIYGILEDTEGLIWFATNNGFSRLHSPMVARTDNPMAGTADGIATLFKNYLYSDGFLGGGNWVNTLVQDTNGIIWSGNPDRLTAFDPGKDQTDSIPPYMHMNAVLLFDQEINWLELENKKDTALLLNNGRTLKDFNFSTVSNWSYTPEELELAYNNNALSFMFTGITINKSERVKYQYMLEGFDDNWGTLMTTPLATYTNLSFGNYTFKAKAMNSDGYWSKELSYPFVIRPPWWLSWWAYAIYGLFFVAGLRIVHQYQKKRVLRLERVKSQKRELEQAKKIEKAYTNLKATQAQLIQSEKMASLGELTAGIAHEIQNPLNFVNNFSEVSYELIDEMNAEIEKGDFEEVIAISSDIKQNLEKINHHGKRADAIVKGMLQHSRSSSGIKEPTDINSLADEYLRLAYHGLRAKDKSFNATMKTDFDSTIGKINVVPQDLGRVILNLITNAFYACAERSRSAVTERSRLDQKGYEPTVAVTTKKEGNQVLITVKDNGEGIPEKVLDKIFQPFFTTKPTGQGTGLGLSLSYDSVKAHGGEINVESVEGEGTKFIIQLPID